LFPRNTNANFVLHDQTLPVVVPCRWSGPPSSRIAVVAWARLAALLLSSCRHPTMGCICAPSDPAPRRRPELAGPWPRARVTLASHSPTPGRRWRAWPSAFSKHLRPWGLLQREVKDDPDGWVPHGNEMTERKARGNFVHTRIHRGQRRP
jgi:hypothetical protein